MRTHVSAAVIFLSLTGAAMAQSASNDPRGGRDPYLAGTGGAARDGCINIPNVPHNSADCSRIPINDLNSLVNRETADFDGRRTGASENARRNKQILDAMRR